MLLYIIIGILSVLFVFLVTCSTIGVIKQKKAKALQATADYVFKTQNGSNAFIYTIKGFNVEGEKKIKIIVQSRFGASDTKDYIFNSCATTICATIFDKRSQKSTVCEALSLANELHLNYTIDIPSEYVDANGIVDLDIDITSTWTLGSNVINEALHFNFNK